MNRVALLFLSVSVCVSVFDRVLENVCFGKCMCVSVFEHVLEKKVCECECLCV